MFGGHGPTVLDLNTASGLNGVDSGHGPIIPPEFLFHGDFKRAGDDLTITSEHGKVFVVHEYFKTDHHDTLYAPNGAALTGDIVAALAGPLAPGQYAQATAPQGGEPPIGRVATLQGTAVAVRNGVAVTLNVGDAVLKGDVIQTQGDSKVGVIFGDGTTFDLGANARMVLNDFVYNPAPGSHNSALINLVQGSITFLAGEVAHTGDMRVSTPVATMGIRGTAVQTDINASDGTTIVSVLFEPMYGKTGEFLMYSLSGQLLATVNDSNNQWTVTPNGPLQALAVETAKTPDQMAQALVAVQTAFQTQQIGQTILQQQPIPPSPQDQHPTQTTPKTQIGSTDLSTTKIAITAGDSATGAVQVAIIKPLDNTPPTIPLVLMPPPPPQIPQQQTQSNPPNTGTFFETGSADRVTPLTDSHGNIVSSSGTLLFTDTAGDHHVLSVTAQPGTIGTFASSITQDTQGTQTEGHVSYTYFVTHSSIASLGAGQTHTDVFNVSLTDGAGNVTTTQFSVVLTGVNDPPVLTVSPTTLTSTGGSTVKFTGAQVTDPDSGDVITLNLSASHGTLAAVDVPAGVTVDDGNGSDGTLQVHGSQAAIDQFLQDGVNYTPNAGYSGADALTVTVHDSAGASDTHSVTISDSGANQPAVISGTTSGSATEAGGVDNATPGTPTVSGTLTDTDPDNPANTFQAVAAGTASDNHYGTYAMTQGGTWTYTLDNSNPVVQAANAQDTLTDTFTVHTQDGTAQQVTVTIHGANDAPSVAAGTDASGSITAVPVATSGEAFTAAAQADLTTPGLSLVNGLGNAPGFTNGFGENVVDVGDDNSTGPIDITSVFGSQGLNFFGTHYTSIYINNNGNITFNGAAAEFTPEQISGGEGNPIIAPFWADVDTRGGATSSTGGDATGSDRVFYDLDTVNHVLTVTWDDVGYYDAHTDKADAFQLQLVGLDNGDFAIVLRYEDIQWTTGDASGGTDGFGGSPARAGYSDGLGNSFELPQSGTGQMVDLQDVTGNTGVAGLDVFVANANGVVPLALTTSGVINFTDPDIGDTHTATATYEGSGQPLGTFTLVENNEPGANGVGQFGWTYSVDPNALASLGANQSVQETYLVDISDGNGGHTQQPVTVTLHGVDDAPVLTLPGNQTHTLDGGTIDLVGGHMSDPDTGDVITLDVSFQHGQIAPLDAFPSGVTVIDGDGSDGTLQVSGSATAIDQILSNGISYTPDSGFATDTGTITVTDASGESASQTVSVDNETHTADGLLANVSPTDQLAFQQQGSGYVGTVTAGSDNASGANPNSVLWFFDATASDLAQHADQTQSYTIQDLSNPSASQTIAISIGASDQFQFQFSPNDTAHDMVNFSMATDQQGNYIGETIELSNFTNAQNTPLTLSDVLADLTTDNHGNAVVNLGHGDSITFQHVGASLVQAQAGHMFSFSSSQG